VTWLGSQVQKTKNSLHFARYGSYEIKYKDYDFLHTHMCRLQQVCLGLAETDTMVNLVTVCGVSSAVSWVYIHFDSLQLVLM
jgi:hypothetical protein